MALYEWILLLCYFMQVFPQTQAFGMAAVLWQDSWAVVVGLFT